MLSPDEKLAQAFGQERPWGRGGGRKLTLHSARLVGFTTPCPRALYASAAVPQRLHKLQTENVPAAHSIVNWVSAMVRTCLSLEMKSCNPHLAAAQPSQLSWASCMRCCWAGILRGSQGYNLAVKEGFWPVSLFEVRWGSFAYGTCSTPVSSRVRE